ncbi:peptidoglycan-binding protein [Anaerococcus sp. NML200574]|uniref:peptidoglycan-binding protein n=1 Tax=Anaerococcus sp. NML200574 TaxID=2954486 RepID=UPI002237E492|nr:peptidoglycan-binding protein [Anaerococcus sp. NML200574]MCW6678387.1 peptidoglycan-binding protein [Anaerococcus sp. NML200574]
MTNKIKLASLALALSLVFVGCGNQAAKDAGEKAKNVAEEAKDAASDAKDKAEDAAEDAKDAAEDAKDAAEDKVEDLKANFEGKLVLRRSLEAPHGEGSFARVAVVTDGEKIVDASIDEFQYFDEGSDFVALPNQDSDTEFKKGAKEGKILGSKIINSEAYSKLMTEKAKSTVSIADNYKAIQDFAKGKTIDELKEVVDGAEDGKAIDAVTGATLVDTKGYLQAIINTAEKSENAVAFEGDPAKIKLQQFFGTAGANNAVTDTFVVVEDGKIVAASIDELQYIADAGVPNSDKKFGENYADPAKKLSSKLENNEEYSKMMKDMAKATKNLDENYKAIEEFVVGKTPEEIKEVIDSNENGKPVDAVTGATLNNTVGYLEEIYKAATKEDK